jgi:predicted dithiol-disulfide oxidoreductase (DUF899 family)
MQSHKIVSREEWIAARKAHLVHEKEYTTARDRLSAERRALPWVKVDKTYVFDGPNGKQTLKDLFAGRSQLVVQHFMFAPDWTEGCKSCSFWADGFERMIPHLAARDTTLVAISRAPLLKLAAFEKRMGWTFDWLSSGETISITITGFRLRLTNSNRMTKFTTSAPAALALRRRPASAYFIATNKAPSSTPIRVLRAAST